MYILMVRLWYPEKKITFAGHGFGTSKDAVTVTFDGVTVPAEINSITPTAIAVNVPNGFKGGKVTMVFDGIDEPVVSDHLQLLPEDGDITPYVLKNYKHEFLVIEGSVARQGNGTNRRTGKLRMFWQMVNW